MDNKKALDKHYPYRDFEQETRIILDGDKKSGITGINQKLRRLRRLVWLSLALDFGILLNYVSRASNGEAGFLERYILAIVKLIGG